MSSLFGGMCANDVIKEAVSPDGRKKVVVFQRNCGATTDFSTQAVLSVGRSLPDDGGNVFSADTNYGAAPSGSGGGPELEASWVGPKELVLEHHAQARVFKAEPSIGDACAFRIAVKAQQTAARDVRRRTRVMADPGWR